MPKLSTSSSLLKRETSCGAKIISGIRIRITMPKLMPRQVMGPFFARSNFPAPRFCPIKVVMDMERDISGSRAKASILL